MSQLRQQLFVPLYANAYALIFNQITSAGLGMLYWAIVTHLFTAETIGQNTAIISTVMFLFAFAELSLKSAMIRFVPRAGNQVKRLVITTYIVAFLASLLVTLLFFALGRYFRFTATLFSDTKLLPMLLFVAPVVWTIFYIQDGVLTGLREAKWVLYENTIFNVLKIGALLGMALTSHRYSIVASWFGPAPLLILLVNWLIFFKFIPRYLKENDSQPAKVTVRQIASSIGGDHVGTIFAEACVRLLPLMVLNMLGKDFNAYFYQAWLIGSTVYLMVSNMTTSFSVEAASNLQQIAMLSRRILVQKARVVVPLAAAVLAFAPIILRIFGDEYSEMGTPLLRWLALAAFPMILNIWYLGYARVIVDNWGVIRNQVIVSVVTLGLSYLWLPKMGIVGIGIAWFIAQLLVALVVLYVAAPILLGDVRRYSANQSVSLISRLRRVDWRFLTSIPLPGRSLVFANSTLADAVQAVTRGEMIQGQFDVKGVFDLAVAVNPNPIVLKSIASALSSDGVFYSEWTPLSFTGPKGIRRQLQKAGFSTVKLFWAYPSVENPRLWIPLEAGSSVYVYMMRQIIRGDKTRHHILQDLLSAGLRLIVSIGFVPCLSVVAYKTSHSMVDVMDVVRKEWAIKNVDANRLTYFMQTGGSQLLNKIIYLVFLPNQPSPSWIVKLPRISADAQSLRLEERILTSLHIRQEHQSQLVFPRILFSREWGGIWISAQSALSGVPLSKLVQYEGLDQLAERITDWQVAMANLSPQRTDPIATSRHAIDALSEKMDLVLSSRLTSQQIRLAKEILDKIRYIPLVCSHNDFAPWNIVQTSDGLGVFDWSDSDWNGLPMMDLIYGLTNLAFVSEDAWDLPHMLQVYRSLLNTQTDLGKIFDRCLMRYAVSVGVRPELIPSLRIATWIFHVHSEYISRVADQDLRSPSSTPADGVCNLLFMHDLQIYSK